jgi:hypothetical protein
MQAPGVYPLALYRGDTHRWQARLWDDTAGGTPVDLTGSTVAAEIRDKPGGTFVVELEATITPPNIIDVAIDGEAMWATCPSKGVWDLQITNPDGDVRTVLRGDVTVTGDVTDSVVPPVTSRRG